MLLLPSSAGGCIDRTLSEQRSDAGKIVSIVMSGISLESLHVVCFVFLDT